MIIQFCGMSGAGKSTLARAAQKELQKKGIAVEVIDGDEYRSSLCRGLGFSKEDRMENIRRMAFVAHQLSKYGIVSIICAINPYEEMRQEVAQLYPGVSTAYIDCSMEILKIRDTKGLYQKAFLSANNPNKIKNLTGINDPFEAPQQPDLYINTDTDTIINCVNKLVQFVVNKIQASNPGRVPFGHHNSNTLFNHYVNL